MQAAIYRRYGAPDVVSIDDVPTPTPRAGEVRIRVHATTVSSSDWRARSLSMTPGFGPFGRMVFGLSRPRQPILGTELSGVIDSLGDGVRTLGAHHGIDYTRADFAAGAAEYDVIVDTVGNAGYACVRRVLAPGGRLLAVLGGFGDLLRTPFAGRRHRHRVIAGPSAARVEELHQLAHIAASGAFTPLIDGVYPFARIVDAHRRVDAGHKHGSVVVTFDPTGTGCSSASA